MSEELEEPAPTNEPGPSPTPPPPPPPPPPPRNLPRREVWSFSPPSHLPQPLVPLVQPKAKTRGYLTPGERIVLGDGDPIVWKSAVLLQKSNTYNKSSYYWYWAEEESGLAGEGFLLQGEPWGVLRPPYTDVHVPTAHFAFQPPTSSNQLPALDGTNTTPGSLHSSHSYSPHISGPVLNPGADSLPPYQPLNSFTAPPSGGFSPTPIPFYHYQTSYFSAQASRLPLPPRSTPPPPFPPATTSEDFLLNWCRTDSSAGSSSSHRHQSHH